MLNVSEDATFSVSRQGRPVILMGRYRFNKCYRSKDSKGYWRCARVRSSGCRATVTTIDDVIIKITNGHSH